MGLREEMQELPPDRRPRAKAEALSAVPPRSFRRGELQIRTLRHRVSAAGDLELEVEVRRQGRSVELLPDNIFQFRNPPILAPSPAGETVEVPGPRPGRWVRQPALVASAQLALEEIVGQAVEGKIARGEVRE